MYVATTLYFAAVPQYLFARESWMITTIKATKQRQKVKGESVLCLHYNLSITEGGKYRKVPETTV